MELDQLSQWEQGLLWAASLQTKRAPDALARLAEPDRSRCQRLFEAVQVMEPQRRRALLAELGRRIFSPLPTWLSRVHPSWLEHLLQAQPQAWRPLLQQLLPVEKNDAAQDAEPSAAQSASLGQPIPAVRSFLLRQSLTPLLPLPPEPAAGASQPDQAAALLSWSAERLQQALLHAGLLLLAAATRQAGSPLRETLADRLEPALRSKLLQALAQDLPRHKLALPGAELWGLTQPQMLFVLGARILGPALGQPLRQQLAQRLPRELGLELLVEAAGRLPTEQALALLQRADSWARGDDR